MRSGKNFASTSHFYGHYSEPNPTLTQDEIKPDDNHARSDSKYDPTERVVV